MIIKRNLNNMTSKLPTYPEYKASGIDWLGDIPSHWECVKSQYIFSLASGETINGEDFSKGGLYPVYGGNGIRGYHDKYNLEGKHILIGRVGALCGNIHITPEKSWVSEHALIATPLKQVNLHWLSSLLETMELGQYSMASAQPVIAASNVGKLHIPIPPIDEQKVIAAYLDDVTGKIDALIAQKRKQVEDIRAYRTSLITETVTHGLNPDAPLRPSGIDWLGDIPQHWETSKLKYYITITNGSDPKLEGDIAVYGSGGASFRTCGEFKEGPSVLLGRKGTINIPRWIEGKYWNVDTAFDCKSINDYNLRFFYYIALVFDYDKYKSNTAVPSMTQGDYNNFILPVPPLAEQQAIADFLDAKTAKIDELISELTKQIDELSEYKQAVITEAVTGKVDVCDYKPLI